MGKEDEGVLVGATRSVGVSSTRSLVLRLPTLLVSAPPPLRQLLSRHPVTWTGHSRSSHKKNT